MKKNIVRIVSIVLIAGALGLFAYNQLHQARANTQSAKLRISMIPTTDPGKMLRESEPFVSYLSREAGVQVEMTVPTSYAAVVEAISSNNVDIAYLGGFTYIQAAKRAAVIPLVQRDRDQNFHSVFITQPNSGINGIADLQSKTFAFGDVNSTSGHLMPEYYMRKQNVDASVIANALYTGGHDATALAVANKKVSAGALDESVLERMLQQGKVRSEDVRIFYKTPAFFDYVWVARKGLDPKLASSFVQAMIKLNSANAEQQKVLDVLNAKKYVEARDQDYDVLREAAKSAGLLQ